MAFLQATTVTGQLNVNNSTPTSILRLYSGGSTAWSLGVGDASGSNFNITADFGSILINKSTGAISGLGAVTASSFSGSGSGLTGTASSLNIGGYSNYVSAQTNPGGVFNVGLTRPKGASYTTTASTVTGAIKIKMPPGTPVHGMWKMTIKIYEYGSRGNGYTIECGCHLYPSTAYNRYQYAIGVDSNIALTIRYGTDGTSGCIWIGENNTTWSYPQIHVTEFSNGFNNPGSVDWSAGTWGVTIGTIDNSVAVDGPYTIDLPLASNATTVTNGVYLTGTQNITGIKRFQSDLGTTSGSITDPPLQVFANGTNAAFMSFHRGGSFAVNMGLDSDNVLRIGGWSASANRLQLDMSGNLTVAGSMYASVFYDSDNNSYYANPAATSNFNELILAGVGTGAYGHLKYGGLKSGDWQSFTNIAGQINIVEVQNIGGGGHTNYPTGVYTYGGVMSWRLPNHSFQLYAAHTGDLAYKTQWGNDNYSGWRRILDSSTYPYAANMNQYVRTTDNVTFGTVTAALSGNATTATGLTSSNYISRVNSSGNYNTDFQNTPAGTVRHQGDDYGMTNNPGGGWWFVDNYRHSNNSNYWGTQVAWGWEDQANKLATRNVQNGTFGSWIYYLNSGNYTDYTVTKTGTGASGTWGISVTGSSGSVAALGVKTGALDDNIVTFAKMQQVTGPVAIGRTTASLGNMTTLSGADLATIIGANTITNATNSTNATTAANVSAAADAAIVNQHNGNSAAWYGRILSKNSTSDKSSFIGTYGSIAGVFAHNNALSAWADLYINTVDGSGGGTVRLPATVLLNGNQVLTTASTLSTANLSGTVAVGNGGTGATSFTAGRVLLGNGTTDITTSANLSYNTGTNRLGVGTTTPGYTLDVGGACHASSFPTSSDIRFKKNIQPLTNALQTILSLRGVKYEWNNFIHSERPGYELNTPVIGMIAQEVENVIPEIVGKWVLNENFQDARSLEYQRIIPYLIEAVKELENKNKLLEARVLALENK